jgi:hypothetical protein
MRGLGENEATSLLVKAVENAGEKCLPILENMAVSLQEQSGGSVDDMAVEMAKDWNFLVSVSYLHVRNTRPVADRIGGS